MSAIVLSSLAQVQVAPSEEARARRDSLLSEAFEVGEIANRLDADAATETLRALSAFEKEVESGRTTAKAPVLDLGRRIDALGKELCEKIVAEKRRISGLLGTFEAEERRKADEERRRIEAEAARVTAEAERKAKEAARLAKSEEQAARAVDAVVEKAQAQIVDLKQRADQAVARKAEGSRLMTSVKFEVVDIHALHIAHPELVVLEPNGTAIRAILKQNPEMKIPGLRIWTETNLSV